MTLRARLVVLTVGLATVGLVAADVATYHFLGSFLVGRVDQQLRAVTPLAGRSLAFDAVLGERGTPRELPAEDGAVGSSRPRLFPTGTYAALLDERGRVRNKLSFTSGRKGPPPPRIPARVSPLAAGAVSGPLLVTTPAVSGATGYRLLAQRVPAGTLVVAIPLTEVTATRRRLLWIEGAVTGLVVLSIAGAGLWLIRRELRPLDRMGKTATAIAAGDLSMRVEPDHARTEVGRLGAALNEMLGQIEQGFAERRASEERLRRFLADASHELRTPVTSIRGYAELFRRGAAERPADLAVAMRRIEEEGERMGELVDELLLLARLDQGLPLEREPVDLAGVAAASVEAARAAQRGRPITLEAAGSAIVLGSATRLRQVVDNLLANVREHTPADTPVQVRVTVGNGEAVLEVADAGSGIPPAEAERIFERFYRADRSRSRGSGGAGLGLAIAKAVVDAHGGRITHHPRPGGGAIFRVGLPAATTLGEVAAEE